MMTNQPDPLAHPGGRNIVLCSDGTGNSGARYNGTNVWKMFKAVNRRDHEDDSTRQFAFYDQGVGTSSLSLPRMISQAFGYGLSRNIRQLYQTLAREYEPGGDGVAPDAIFMFGFSRGAYTVRSLAGLIADMGLVDGRHLTHSELTALVHEVFRAYRSNDYARRRDELQKEKRFHEDVPIHFLGVWDTVGALGFPIDLVRTAFLWTADKVCRYRPHNIGLTPNHRHVYHPLAIDDDRASFRPELFDVKSPPATARVTQVWFAGAHSNVGGGYPRQGMSDVSCLWMMRAAMDCGLRLNAQAVAEVEGGSDAHCTQYDPRSGFGAYYRYQPRQVADLCAQAGLPVSVHASVIDRIEHATDGYAPVNLPSEFAVSGGEDRACSRCDATRAERTRLEQRIWRMIRNRRWLYYTFVLASILVASFCAVLAAKPERITRYHDSAIGQALGGLVGDVFGGAGEAGRIAQEIAIALTPGPLQKLVVGLFQLPEVVFMIGLVGCVLYAIRARWLAAVSDIGLAMWQAPIQPTPETG